MNQVSLARLTVIAALVLAAGGYAAGGYSLYRLLFPNAAEDDMSELSIPVLRCLEEVHDKDQYTLFSDNKRRIITWCTERESRFANERPQMPADITEAKRSQIYICISRWMEHAPPEPLRTIEDVFDFVMSLRTSREDCYGQAGIKS
jgi:hypothetical protein